MKTSGRKEGSYKQATRVVRLLDSLRRHVGLTMAEIADKFEITERQARRDLAALEEAGYPLDRTVDEAGRARVRIAGIRPGTIQLGVRERFTLLAIRRVFDVLRGTPDRSDCAQLASSIGRRDHETLPSPLLLAFRGRLDASVGQNVGDGSARNLDLQAGSKGVTDLRITPSEVGLGHLDHELPNIPSFPRSVLGVATYTLSTFANRLTQAPPFQAFRWPEPRRVGATRDEADAAIG